MRTEIPVCKRFCFCLPLRYGLIVWGYLRLILAIIFLISLCLEWHAVLNLGENSYMFTTGDRVVLGLWSVITTTDILLTLVFIVGCHKKNVKLMKTFYFYGQFLLVLTTGLTINSFVLSAISLTNYSKQNPNKNVIHLWMFEITQNAYFVHLILQLYMILLVRSEIIKLNNSYQFSFVNAGADTQCSLDDKKLNKTNERLRGQDNEVTSVNKI